MKKYYTYIYYRFYNYLKTTKNHENAAHGACILMCVIDIFLSLTVIVYIKNIFDLNLFNKATFLFYAILLYYIHTKIFDNSETILKIEERYKNETLNQKKIGSFITLIIFLLSFALMVSSSFISIYIKNINF